MTLVSGRLVLSIALVLTAVSLVPASSCLDSRIDYDTSTLEKIVRSPERVLEDEDAFWQDEKAQIYTTAWAKNVGLTISRKKWRGQIEEFAELTEEQRTRMWIASAILVPLLIVVVLAFWRRLRVAG